MVIKKPSSCARDKIVVRGARVNNLKNINVDIPRDKFVVITGLSGSGKSSLAFDTIYAEGNRRYMEGLSSYARLFLDIGAKPEVEGIENLSPAIAIDQRGIGRSSRSTVGTLTEIYDYLRVLYAKLGRPFCSRCGVLMRRKNNEEILEEILSLPENSQLAVLGDACFIEGSNLSNKEILSQIRQIGYARVRIGGKIISIEEALTLSEEESGREICVVVDRFSVNRKNFDRERILDSIETAMKIGSGSIVLCVNNEDDRRYNRDFVCESCGAKIKELNMRHFSFNNPEGACEHCSGLGTVYKIDPDLIIPNKNLSLSEGAIKPLNKIRAIENGNGYYASLKAIAEKNGFSLTTPIKKLSKNNLRSVLYGEKESESVSANGRPKIFFEGVIPMLERKHREIKSDYARNEIERYMTSEVCPLCSGKRLKEEYLSVLVAGKSIHNLVSLDILSLENFFRDFAEKDLSEAERKIFQSLAREILERVGSLKNVGLEYLSLARGAQTISGGEAQRIRLAVQLNSQLMGIVYVLDEPSVGLHKKDNQKLIQTICSLRDKGNSLIVVEHDEEIMKAADWIVDMGPGAGENGGEVIFSGEYQKLLQAKTLTGDYLSGRKKVVLKKKTRSGKGKLIEVFGAVENNLKNLDVKIPLGKFVTVCGVSGSGKSTLVNDILSKALARRFWGAKESPGKHKNLKGLENIDKVISIDQSPIGRTPRSNAVTYTGIFSHIREIFSEQEESKKRGYSPSQFSFNMKGGRCEVCQGDGLKKIEMHLLPDMYVHCEACGGTRYGRKTLEIEYKGRSIAQVLEMDINFAYNFFIKHPPVAEKLKTLKEVGLGYLKLGQSATNLSGGEAQRIKLATELARKSTGKTLYILDEPTVGLHFEDTAGLLKVLDALVDKGNSVLVVEHNLDVIRNSDWIIELGPEGGPNGGRIIFEGTPEKMKKEKTSQTGKYL